MRRVINCFPLGRGDAAVLVSGSNTANVSVRAEHGSHVLVQLESDPDDRRLVARSNLKPRNAPNIRFTK
ncbi:hypothetical protein [Salinibacter phage M31CR41-2]|uniref:Uncharacterized protein n=1 Tax=Salinibacter phage M31CR41-2 TaxID=2681614 RepID=A0A2I6UH57_9CAUD|nr:hypothetical protein FGG68_gp47 [Salinibacter phage M31CR41-2]AUO79328.1 hypothetical protein [Salinibacter phage M31CR41-2]